VCEGGIEKEAIILSSSGKWGGIEGGHLVDEKSILALKINILCDINTKKIPYLAPTQFQESIFHPITRPEKQTLVSVEMHKVSPLYSTIQMNSTVHTEP